VTPVALGPRIPLLHHARVGIEAEKRGSGERLPRTVLGGYDGPPVDRGSSSVDDGLSEPALGGSLVVEGPGDVLRGALPLAKRVRVEDGVVRVQRRDGRDVGGGPRVGPDRRPAPCCVSRVYFATSIARDSRMTITLT
jgi:hypothetical protein